MNSLLDSKKQLFTTGHKPNVENLHQGHNYYEYHSKRNKCTPGRHRDRGNSSYNSQNNMIGTEKIQGNIVIHQITLIHHIEESK